MIAICLGIAAALAWGLHDFFVRTVSQNSGIFASIITVFGTGVVILGACVVAFGNPVIMTPLSYQLSIASRISFAIAGVAVYMAFAIGPVSLVAPIFGAYPILSVGWAAVSGTPVSGLQWLAVLTVVAGVAGIAALSSDTNHAASRTKAIFWAATAAIGFAATFAFSQAAVVVGDELTSMLTTRIVAFGCVLALALAAHQPVKPKRAQIPLLVGMGWLDMLALGFVAIAGLWPHQEYAAVTSSVFGIVTVILAWAILKEPMRPAHWICVCLTFIGILALGALP
jgi:drug/metabolite transporter (DMT)-like permease